MPNNAVTLRHTEPNDYPELEIRWNDHAIADDCRHTMEKVPDKTIDQMFHTWSDEDDDRRFGRTILGPDGHPVAISSPRTAPRPITMPRWRFSSARTTRTTGTAAWREDHHAEGVVVQPAGTSYV